MMKFIFPAHLILTCGLFLGLQPVQAAGDSFHKETLVVIGYADENHIPGLKGFFAHDYFFEMAQMIETTISEELVVKGYDPDPRDPSRWIQNRTQSAVTVLNSNYPCANEERRHTIRGAVCPEQLKQSEKLKIHLEQNLNRFDRFIYIGHSRLGLGLGIGPFYNDKFTFVPRFHNASEAGRLQNVLIASCDSEKYYAQNFALQSRIHFQGTHGPLRWVEDLLPMVLKALN